MRMRARTATVSLLVGVLSLPLLAQSGGPRVVAVGDIHGAAAAFVGILQTAGLIDSAQRWTGGAAVFVQTGDYLDRGAQVREVLDLLMRLERDARRQRGRAEILIGNHEVMNMLRIVRDVSPDAYASFADRRSEDKRQNAYRAQLALIKRTNPDGPVPDREAWMKAHPAGFLEYLEALGPKGRYGRWLRSRKVMHQQGDTIFMHAGVRPETTGTLEEINTTVERDLEAWDATTDMMIRANLILPFYTFDETLAAAATEINRIATALTANEPPGEHVTRELVDRLQALGTMGTSSLLDPEGPMWFRGWAEWPDESEPMVKTLLERFQVSRFVGGHTPQPGRIVNRFTNRVFLIDSGMLSSVYEGGEATALELEGDRVTVISKSGREVLAGGER